MTELLKDLRSRDIKVWREGGNLRFSAPAGALTPELRAQLTAHKAELLAHLSDIASAGTVIPRIDRTGGVPLSFAQERLWMLDRLEPGMAAYNVAHCWRIAGPLDPAALERSLHELARRHEILRTTFSTAANGTPLQTVHPFAARALPLISIAPGDLAAIAEAEAARPFDLVAGPLWRTTLARLGESDHALFLTWHHIICDAWSDAIFARELTALYAAIHAGQPSPLPALPLQFGDYAHWQRATSGGAALAAQLAFWRARLRGDRPPLPLPADRPRPARQSHRGAVRTRDLSSGLAAQMRDLARTENVTLFILTLAAFKALLARYCGEADICVGTPIMQRPNVETEGLIGFFLNMLALRSDLSGDPGFRELLQRVRATTLAAFQHQDVPFEKIVEDLHPSRDLSHQPLFQVAFVLQPSGETAPAFPGATVEPLTTPVTTAKFDLTLFLEETREGMRATMEYSTDQFEAETVDRMLASLELLLGGIVADPATPLSRLPILSAAEQRRILTEWSGSERAYPRDQTISDVFAKCAAATPAAIAVVEGSARLTYAELDTHANRIAHFLQARGIRAGDFVGLRAERSLAFVVKLLGIAKAGAAYLPLDDKEPAERLAAMKAACTLIIDAEPDGDLPAGPVLSAARADGPAYVLFTSGSTGVPKGVVVPHRGITRLVINNDYAPFQPDDVVAFASNVCFDAATFDIWGALLNGAKLVVVPQDVLLSASDFAAFLAERGVTTLFLTTALFNQIARQNPAALRPLKHVLFGGEACNPDCVRRVLDHGAPQRLIHVYGPTETTTFASWHLVREVPADAVTVPIGQPIANTTIHLLDSGLQALPSGVIGEIFIGGPGVAFGYLNDPELTAARFLETQFGRLYRTGDLARRRADGAIEFCGRIDSQLKLRGFRIEPGEIETALQRHASVRQATVVVREIGQDRALVAYLVPGDTSAPGDAELRGFLQHHLPAPMVPAAFVWLPALPLTPSGKLDQRALPSPSVSERDATATSVAPRNDVESSVAKIWAELLGRNSFSVHDDFFAVGGHSLLAIQLLARLREKFRVDVPVRRLFETPTIEGVARFLAAELPPPPPLRQLRSLITIQRGEPGQRPFFLVPGGWGGEVEFLVYAQIKLHVGADLPIYGLKARGFDGIEAPHRSVREMAVDYVDEIRTVQPHGPYLLGGECIGGVLAYEMARRLEELGERLGLLVMLDTWRPSQEALRQFSARERSEHWITRWNARVVQPFHEHIEKLSRLTPGEKVRYVWQRATRKRGCKIGEDAEPTALETRKQLTHYPRLLMAHPVGPYSGKLTLLIDETSHRTQGSLGWDGVPTGGLEIHLLPGDHVSYIREHAAAAAAKLRAVIDRANQVPA